MSEAASQTPAGPPYADRVPCQRTLHGDVRGDDLAWMRDHDDPRLMPLIEAENAHTRARTTHLDAPARTLFEEFIGRIEEDNVSVPVRLGDWWYFHRTRAGQQYDILARTAYVRDEPRPSPTPTVPAPGEQIVFDGNVEAQGAEFFELGALEISPDGRRVAVLVDRTGGELYDLQVRDAQTGAILDEQVQRVGHDLAWSADGRYLFYVRRDAAWRGHQVWRHELATPADHDDLLFEEADELFEVSLEASRDDRWLVIHSCSRSTTEARLLDLTDPAAEPVVVEPRTTGLDYSVELDGDRILVTHNGSHADFELSWAPLTAPGRDHWQTVVAPAAGERIVGPVAFASFVALELRSGGLGTIWIVPKQAGDRPYGPPRPIGVGSALTLVSPGNNPRYDQPAVQVVLTSFLTPRTVLDVFPDGTTIELKKQQVPGYVRQDYVEERVWVVARDGEQLPLDIVRRADVSADGSNPGYLYGYGSYEASFDPFFSVWRLSMLDRGVVYALAHPRGGGELGRRWYEDGRLLAKPNTFNDFVDSGRHLVASGWVAPGRLAAEGASAGGLLIGAAINQAPELFRVVHAEVPFVDVLTTITDPSLPLTIGEWEEWGNPLDDPEIYACLKSYSPYDNIRPVRYPAILATTSINDTRVSFVEAVKWTQRLRATVSNGPDRPILLRTEVVAGHAGSSGRYDAWKQHAFVTAFLLEAIDAIEVIETPVGRESTQPV